MPVNTSAIQIEFNQPPPELTRNSSKCTFEFRAEILSLSRKSLYYCRLSLFSPCSTVYISISCPYKIVEFGAKCNNILIDGISFIEKLSFNAFNEGTRLKHCVSLSKKLTGVDVKKIGGDQGYSGNDNRTFCKENGIETSFTQKGRTGKNEVKNATKRELARVRATAMEGSFGTQKEHYGLRKIAARIKSTEIMLIFFGIHTANVVNLARRESVQVALAA